MYINCYTNINLGYVTFSLLVLLFVFAAYMPITATRKLVDYGSKVYETNAYASR